MDFEQMIWDGTTLSRDDVDKRELVLKLDPTHLEFRANLIGYYFWHHYCCHATRFNRLSHIIWTIKNANPYPRDIASFMDLCLPERTSYKAVKKAFEKRLAQNPADSELTADAAYFVTRHDPKLAEKLYVDALKINPNAKGLQTRLENLRRNKKGLLANKKHYAKVPTREYFSYAAPCRHLQGSI
jgi:hypothetical protein